MAPLVLITVGWALGGIPSPIYLGLLAGLPVLVSVPLLITYKLPAARHRRLRYLVDAGGLRIRVGYRLFFSS